MSYFYHAPFIPAIMVHFSRIEFSLPANCLSQLALLQPLSGVPYNCELEYLLIRKGKNARSLANAIPS